MMDKALINNVKKFNKQLAEVIPNTSKENYNCYGFVAGIYKWEKGLRWLGMNTMENMLMVKSQCIPASQRKPGDIVVYRDKYADLIHTAIIISNDDIIHKPGGMPLEISNLEGTIGTSYHKMGRITTFRRPFLTRSTKSRFMFKAVDKQFETNKQFNNGNDILMWLTSHFTGDLNFKMVGKYIYEYDGDKRYYYGKIVKVG